ncbi:MAG: SpoIIE family protein phosphatase [Acidobacteriota bacterium]
MKKRHWVLLALCGLASLFWVLDVHQLLFGRGILRTPGSIIWVVGMVTGLDGGYLTVVSVRDTDSAGNPSPAAIAGVEAGDRIFAVYNARGQGGPVRSLMDYTRTMRTIQYGEPWALDVLRQAAQGPRTVRIMMPPSLPSSIGIEMWLLRIVSFVVLPLLAITTALLLALIKPEDRKARLASYLFLGLSALFGKNSLVFPPGLREAALLQNSILGVFAPYLMMRFFLVFPSPSVIERRLPWIKTVGFALSVVAAMVAVGRGAIQLVSFDLAGRLSPSPDLVRMAGALVFAPMCMIGLASLVENTIRAESRDEKRRMTILLSGALIGLLPYTLLGTYGVLRPDQPPSMWRLGAALLCVLLFPLSFIYAVAKHRVFGIRLILRRGLQYALVSRGFLVVEAALIFSVLFFGAAPLLSALLPGARASTIAIVTGAVTSAAVIGLRRANMPVLHAIDRRFFREAYNAQHVLTDLSQAVRRLAARPDDLLATVTDALCNSLHPDHAAIFLRKGDTSFRPVMGSDGRYDPLPPGTFVCARHQVRTGHAENDVIESFEQHPMSLPQNALVVREVERLAAEEPRALEVWLDDPKSWARPLADAQPADQAEYQERRLLEILNTRLLVPLSTGTRLMGFISLGEKLSEEPYSREDKELLLAVAGQAAVALDYTQLIVQVAEQEKLQRELQIAGDVQSQLFPQAIPSLSTIDCAGACKPARGIGGDYFDFVEVGPRQLGIAVGDISGKGVSAALLMSNLQALLRSHAPALGREVERLMGTINRYLHASSQIERYATFFYGLYDDDSRCLTYVNAGHNPPMLVRAASPDRRLERLEMGGTILGVFPDASYESATIELQPEDMLLVYTDGLPDAKNERDEEFGDERVARLVAAELGKPASDVLQSILAAVNEFVGSAPQADDLTLVVVTVR